MVLFAWVWSAPASAADRDLLTSGDLRIDGAAAGHQAGFSVTSVGDLDDDGLDDIAIGVPKADFEGDDSGSVYVVLGRDRVPFGPPATVNLAADGIRIDGGAANDGAGSSVSGAGDVNNDGFADLVIGAPGADVLDRGNAGAAYVVFGQANFAPLKLAQLGSRGFLIQGESANGAAGSSVSGASHPGTGDMDSDGYDDLVVGAPGLPAAAGRVYVVYGKEGTGSVDLNPDNLTGFKITSEVASRRIGSSVALVPRNEGGRVDVAVGAQGPYAYVVYGRSPDAQRISLGPAEDGVVGNAHAILASAGAGADPKPVAAVDDLNGDGRSEILVGHPRSRAAYVTFGSAGARSQIDTSVQGSWGYRIFTDGDDGGLFDFGASVAGIADLNRDGRAEALIGAPQRDVNPGSPLARINAGQSYVVYGRADTDPVHVTQPPDPTVGFAILGAAAGEESGSALAGLNDFDGDAVPDLALAAPLAANGGPGSGSVYVVSGGEAREDLLTGLPLPPPAAGTSLSDARDDDDEPDVVAAGDPREPGESFCIPDLNINEDYCGELEGAHPDAVTAAGEPQLAPEVVPPPGTPPLGFGIADQKADFLTEDIDPNTPGVQRDPAFAALGVSKVRLAVPFDLVQRGEGKLSYPIGEGEHGPWLDGHKKRCGNRPASLRSSCWIPVARDQDSLAKFVAVYNAAYPGGDSEKACPGVENRTKSFELLVSFEHSKDHRNPSHQEFEKGRWGYAPTTKRYKKYVARFLQCFPTITWYTAWNEPNFGHQPTGPHKRCRDSVMKVNTANGESTSDDAKRDADRICARRAGRYWQALSTLCAQDAHGAPLTTPRCTVVAGDFSDNGAYSTHFHKAYLRGMGFPQAARFWGWHPYRWGRLVERDPENPPAPHVRLLDFLVRASTPGEPQPPRIWITEGGGTVSNYFPELPPEANPTTQHLADAIPPANADLDRLLYELPRDVPELRPRLTRFYVYQWKKTNPGAPKEYDSALMQAANSNPTGTVGRRCLYHKLKERLDGGPSAARWKCTDPFGPLTEPPVGP